MRLPAKIVVLLAVATASAGLAAGGGAAAAKKCKPTQVALTVAGQRTCVARAKFRPTRSPQSEAAAYVGEMLTRPQNATRKRDKRRVVLRPLPVAFARLATAKTAELEAAARLAVQAAFTAKTNARPQAADGPAVAITSNADGSVTGTASASVTSGGNTATVTVELNAHEVAGQLLIDLGIETTVQTKDGVTTSFGVTAGDALGKPPAATCPTADGAIRLDDTWRLAVRKSDVYKAGAANLGTIRSAGSVSGTATATARMSPDATLTPFRFAISDRADIAVSTRALAFINSQQRVVVTGRLAGTLDPVSGQIAGASASVNVVTTGVPAGDAVVARTKARLDMEKALRDRAGRILQTAKEVEKRARDGKCTKLIFTPATPGELAPNGNVSVGSRLETATGEKVVKVKWTASATKGSVTPASSPATEPTWSVTGAADGPEVANIPVRAVSPAGISEVPWVGGLVFPRTYSGLVTYAQDALGWIDSWTAAATFTRTSIQPGPNTSQIVRYTLTSSSVNSYFARVPGPVSVCEGSASTTGGHIVFGDLEINVDSAGTWTSAFVVDVDPVDFPMTCTPANPPFPGLYPSKSVLNSRQVPGLLLRPMPAGGPIKAIGVSDLGLPTFSIVGTWDLQPGV